MPRGKYCKVKTRLYLKEDYIVKTRLYLKEDYIVKTRLSLKEDYIVKTRLSLKEDSIVHLGGLSHYSVLVSSSWLSTHLEDSAAPFGVTGVN